MVPAIGTSNINSDSNERSVMSERTEGAVLVARDGGEYYFVQSVFKHDDDFAGCTGICCDPVTEEHMDYLLSTDNLVERYGDHWEEISNNALDENCEACDGFLDEEGCVDCGYPSVESFCSEIGQYEGSSAVIDDPGGDYAEALNAIGIEAEYANCSGCGRIFGRMSLGDFDEVYNRKALVACLAYEDGAVDYDYACKVIFGK
jgi:hypothetical protein